jgi:hypothetical protein
MLMLFFVTASLDEHPMVCVTCKPVQPSLIFTKCFSDNTRLGCEGFLGTNNVGYSPKEASTKKGFRLRPVVNVTTLCLLLLAF